MGKKRIKTSHRLYNPTNGIRIDFKRFMNAFIKLKTVRYEEFSKLWCEKKMEYLYLGRNTDREAREFIEEIILIAQEYFLPPYQFQVRVGGLYMLYAIYEIQPTLPKVKIRMTLSQWNDTISFEQQASQQKHLDVMYIIHRLYQEKAFLLCCTPTEHNPFSNAYESVDREEDLADNLKEEPTIVTEHFNFDSLEQVSFLLEQYQRAKISFAGPDATKPDKSLDVLSGNFSDDLVGLIQSYKEEVSELLKSASQTSVNEADDESTGNKRKHLKDLAFADKASSSKVNQFVDTELGSKDPESRRRSNSPRKKLADSEKNKINSAVDDEKDIIPTKSLKLDNDSGLEQKTTEQNKAVSIIDPVPVISKEAEALKHNVHTDCPDKAKSESAQSARERKRKENATIISSLLGHYGKALSISMDYCKSNKPRSDRAFKEPSFKKVPISANEILVLPPDHVMKNLKAQQFSVMDKQQPKLNKRYANRETVSAREIRLPGDKHKAATKCTTTDAAQPGSCAILRAGENISTETEKLVPPSGLNLCGSGSGTKPAVRAKTSTPSEALLKLKQKCSADVRREESKGQKRPERIFTPDTSLIDDKEVLFDIKKTKLESYPLSLTKSTECASVKEKKKTSGKSVTNKKKVLKTGSVSDYKCVYKCI